VTLEVAGDALIQLGDGDLGVAIAPRFGGKITSLRAQGHEWLTPAVPGALRQYPPGTAFAHADMSGWDEMLPTIIACEDPTRPESEVALPDHGDLWDRPWEIVDRGPRELTLRATSSSLPLTLSRRVSIERGAVCLDYQVHNGGLADVPYLWAAHPQFRCAPGTRVVLPNDVVSVVNAQQDALGDLGEVLDWPLHGGFDLGFVRDVGARDCRKVYAPPEQTVACASLVDGAGRSLTLSWDGGAVPYLGIWIDEGRYSREPVCALEPCTGFFDSLSDAVRSGRCAVVAPGATRSWSLAVRFGR
jgi:galactose mutarotase-like enzyme